MTRASWIGLWAGCALCLATALAQEDTDPVEEPGEVEVEPAAPAGPDEAPEPDAAEDDEAREQRVRDTFVPTEEIWADSAISFPVDI